MATNCSHWWHAPIYLAVSVSLAIVAITTSSSHSNPKSESPLSPMPDPPISHDFSFNASVALRKSGFNFMATLLQISPELFLPPSQSTIFAIKDPLISNISLPPWIIKHLLHYHTSPSKLLMDDLLNKRQGSCVSTLLHGKNLAITKINIQERLVEINGVLISHPDIFTQGPYSIHGVVRPFSSIDPLELQSHWDFIRSPICDPNLGLIRNITESRNMIPWTRILRLLSLNGFISFATGLHSVLDGILQDSIDLSSVTIFAPLEFAYVSSPSPLLEKIVRFHILPGRYTYMDLASLPSKASLRTLAADRDLDITMGINVGEILSINGVEITAQNVLSSKDFIIHGISRPFEIVKFSRTSS